MARLTKTQWLEAEELYRQGWTQKEIAEKYGVRPESVSLHMNKIGLKGGENQDLVRREIELALMRKQKEFAEKKAMRTIDTKEKLHTLVNAVLAMFVQDMQNARASGLSLANLTNSGKSLKESLAGLKLAREELYQILEIKPETDEDDLPELGVSTLTPDEENELRAAKAGAFDDDDVDELLNEAAEQLVDPNEEAEPLEEDEGAEST
jgi:transcriptional regulator with XRE-family HTH domain